MRLLIVLVILALSFPAMAQQTVTPAVLAQALSQRLMEEINSNIQLRAQLLQAQEELKQMHEAPAVKSDQEKKK